MYGAAAGQASKSYNIPVFKPSRIEPGEVVVMVGKRHSGKGYTLKCILHELKDKFATVVLFSGTEQENAAWAGTIPDAFIYDQFDGDALARIVDAQRKLVREHGRSEKTNMLIIFDDVMHDAGIFTRDRAMKDIFFAGRHSGITTVLLLQYVLSIPPALRSNVDKGFFFAEPIYSNLVLLHKHYGGVCGTYKQFETLHKALTENYSCMVIQLSRLKSNSVDKAVAFFKATQPPSYKLGSAEQWEFNRKFSMSHNKSMAKNFKQIRV